MSTPTPWAVVTPLTVQPRPRGVFGVRSGKLSREGTGGGLCWVQGHAVYVAERGEPNQKGERERFWCCAVCLPPPMPDGARAGEEPER